VKQFLLLTALLFLIPANAAPATNVYDVEVLVFENRISELEGGELWTTGRNRAPLPEPGAMPPFGAAVGDMTLKNTAAALEKSGDYRVLVHQRWRQAAEEKSATKPMWLRNADGQMEGSFRFYMSRFLHVDLDLVLRDKRDAAGVNYRLMEHRRVKTQDLQYFDHPKLGVLVRITQAGKD
jgi:hypothetical protein